MRHGMQAWMQPGVDRYIAFFKPTRLPRSYSVLHNIILGNVSR
jgi:hypothetical protein